jgi:hypothetical protein
MMPERKPKTPTYENGTRSDVLRYALDCAVRDREAMLESIAGTVDGFWKMPIDQALAKLNKDDRAYFIEIESYIRDFEKMGKKLG